MDTLLKGNGVVLRELLSTTIQQIYSQYGIRANTPVLLKCQSESKEENKTKKDLLKTVLKIFPILSNAKLIDVGL